MVLTEFHPFEHHRQFGVLAIVSLAFFISCTHASPPSETSHARDEQSEEGETTDAYAAIDDPRTLRQEYPDLNGGDACDHDTDCDAPLRCLAQECAFPAAMTGLQDARTPTVEIHTEKETLRYALELARDLPEQRRGLMHRRHMASDFGMLFIYDTPSPQSFWMKNTYLPLDILFIDDDLRIESIVHEATPLSTTPRASKGPAQYVLELRAGQSKKQGIRVGDRVTFSGLPSATP